MTFQRHLATVMPPELFISPGVYARHISDALTLGTDDLTHLPSLAAGRMGRQ